MLKAILLCALLGFVSDSSHSRHTNLPDPPAPFERFTILTDSIPRATIAGVILPAQGRARGTLFLCHGYGRSKEYLYGWDWIRRELKWNLVLFDFREHGQSTHSRHLCSLGYFEIWDVKAVIDLAEQRNLAGPYAIYGQSLGGSIGMRWAAQDGRVEGVLAVSPYRNGLSASEKFLRAWTGCNISLFNAHPGWRKIVASVDLPADVSQRRDLRLWIMCGEHDIFPASDQRAILAASPAPQPFKRLFVIPGASHNDLWQWRGDERVPSHDRIIREFLDECRRSR